MLIVGLKGGGVGWGGRQHLLKGGGLIKGVLNKLAQHWVKIKELMTHKRTLQACGVGNNWNKMEEKQFSCTNSTVVEA